MEPLQIIHKYENSDYESSLEVMQRTSGRWLVAISDNNGIDAVFLLEPEELERLREYLEKSR